LEAINFALSFGVFALLFAAIFKVLPDATIAWSSRNVEPSESCWNAISCARLEARRSLGASPAWACG